jgi:hypothetical protein
VCKNTSACKEKQINQESKSAAHSKSVHAFEQNIKNKIGVTYNQFAIIFGQRRRPDFWLLTGVEILITIEVIIPADFTFHTSHVNVPDGMCYINAVQKARIMSCYKIQLEKGFM